MIKGVKWYLLRLNFSDFARGPKEYLESHVLKLAKRHKLVAVTILKEHYHYNMFGSPGSNQLFGSYSGTKPIIMEIFISEIKLDSFIKELEMLAIKGKSNVLYSTFEVSAIIGNPSVVDKLDDYKE